MARRRILRLSFHVAALVFFLYAYLLCVKPLSDPDLWWHLKSGQWIIQNRELPDEDPFSFTSPKPLDERAKLILRNEWLGQVVLYLSYQAGGYAGLAYFRALLVVGPFFLIYLFFARRGRHPLVLLSAVAFPLLLLAISRTHAFERPQAFSFTFALCLAGILYKMRGSADRRPLSIMLVLLMAIWGNFHGGVVFGAVLIAVFGAGLILESAVLGRKENLKLLLPLAAGMIASMANPCTYKLLLNFVINFGVGFLGLGKSVDADLMSVNYEYQPLWVVYRDFGFVYPIFEAAFVAVALAVVAASYARRRRIDLPWAAAFLVFVSLGVVFYRMSSFSMVSLPAFIVLAQKETWKVVRLASTALMLVIAACLVVVVWSRTPGALRPSTPDHWVDRSYPQEAVRFVLDNGIDGPMFNDQRWGGYLTWRLYPEQKVFFDGRILSPKVAWTYNSISMAQGSWREMLDVFGVNYILVEVFSKEIALVTPLVLDFVEDEPEAWKLVFFEGNSAIFLRDVRKNEETITKYAIPTRALYGTIYKQASRVLRTRPGNPNALLSLAIALEGYGRSEEALGILRQLPTSDLRDRYIKRAGG